MSYKTIINAEVLQANLNNPSWIIIDCRFSLADHEAGAKAYRLGHIPNARYAHLEKDLSSAITNLTGRHPLPNFTTLTAKLGQWGVNNRSQVIVYDDAGGAIAGRLWWLMRCLGHIEIALLDGGIGHWQQHGYPVTTTLPDIHHDVFRSYPSNTAWMNAFEVQNSMARKSISLIDARTSERFYGRYEPVDPVAGHIPGAVNRPYLFNLSGHGSFLPAEILRKQFNDLIGNRATEQVVHMCGSGVTACHNLLAMEIAGLTGSKLYPGSWSDWIRDKNRPIANTESK